MRRFVLPAILAAIAIPFAAPAYAAGPETLRGQVVCSECWFEQKDRKSTPYGSQSELKCAVRCSKDGIPQALAVWNGDTVTLHLLEKGSIVMAAKDFLEFAGRDVQIRGETRVEGTQHHLRVDALEVLGPAAASTAATQIPDVGSPAPELTLRDLIGQQQTLSASRGRIVVLNFWATWCLPCRKEMPAFVKIQAEYAAWGVQVIAASADATATEAQVLKFVRENKLSFPIWLGATTENMLAMGLGPELPGTVIIDRDGRIAARFTGIVTESILRKEIDGILERQRRAAGMAPVARAGASSVPS